MSVRVSTESLIQCLQRPINSVSLRRAFLMILREHWGDPANHGDSAEDLACLSYDDDGAGNLNVTMNYLFDVKKTENYPAVILGFGDFVTQKNVTNNYAGMSDDYGSTFYAMPTHVTMTVSHIHERPDGATAMAESTATFLMGTRDYTARTLNLRRFDVVGISSVKPLENLPARYFNVEVSAYLEFNMAVTVNLEGHRLKKYGQELNTEPA